MATVFIHSAAFLDEVFYNKGDDIVIVSGSVLTVRQSNTIAPRWLSSSFGEIKFSSSAVPIIFHVSGANAVLPSGGGIRVFDAGVFSITGSWYTCPELGTGIAHQTATLYHDSMVPMVRVETSASSNEWIYFSNLFTDTFTKFAGPERILGSFFTQSINSNKIKFGSGTFGHIPPLNARIQIPDILITSSGAYATANANKAQIDSTNTGQAFFDTVNFSDRIRINFTQPKTVKLKDCGIFLPFSISECYDVELSGVVVSKDRRVNAVGTTLNAIKANRIVNLKSCAVSASNAITITDCNDVNFYNCQGIIHSRSSATVYSFASTTSVNLLFSGCFAVAAGTNTVSCKGVTFRDFYFGNNMQGSTVTSNAQNLYLVTAGCFDLRFANTSRFVSGSMFRTDILNLSDCQNVIFTGFSGNLENQAANLATIGQGSVDVLISSCSFGQPRTALITDNNGALRVRLSNLYGTTLAAASLVSQNAYKNNVYAVSPIGTAGTTTYPATYDSPFTTRISTSDFLTGAIHFTPTPPTLRNYFSATFLSGTPYFNNNGALIMPFANTVAEIEWDTPIYGVKSFRNVGAIVSGSTFGSNVRHEYAIKHENSSSYTSFKTGSAANLISESVDPSIGFKLKLRFTCLTGNINNSLVDYSLAFFNDTSVLYPVGYVNLTLKNLISGSRYWVFNSSSAQVLTSSIADINGDLVFKVPYDFNFQDVPVIVRVRKSSETTKYQPFETVGSYNASGGTVFVSLIEDAIVS